MSNEIKKLTISTEDIVKAIMEKYNIHEGFYILLPELTVSVSPHVITSDDQQQSEQHIGVTTITTGYSLIESSPELQGNAWDAANLNPQHDKDDQDK